MSKTFERIMRGLKEARAYVEGDPGDCRVHNAINSETDYKAAMAEVARLWGAPLGTPDGDCLDVLATLIDAYEAKQYPTGPDG